eukprot:jgi/Mesvir1/25105/Mv21568-RA.1
MRMAYCLQKLALGKDAMDHKVFILAFHTQLLKNAFDGTPRLRGMAVPSISKGRAGRHSGTHEVGSLAPRDLNLPTSHSGMVCVVCRVRSMKACSLANTDPPKQGARARTWCKLCDLAMCSPDCFNDFHNPLIKLPYT